MQINEVNEDDQTVNVDLSVDEIEMIMLLFSRFADLPQTELIKNMYQELQLEGFMEPQDKTLCAHTQVPLLTIE